jgi:DNA-binding NarL/FixJ family response regulator
VTGTAKDIGMTVRTARNAEALLKLAADTAPTCAIIDLANPGLNISTLVPALKQLQPPPRLVAYGSHVDVVGLQAARDAGCDIVMARSQFVASLPRDLAQWLAAS